jgi:HAD superfamily hydrolase (TIGR01509 family)
MHGIIFDIDGTLVDTNPAHVQAWRLAFERFGFEVPLERIVVEIGKGGDKLVPSVLGEDLEERVGEALRTALATSSDEKHLEATLASAGLDLRRLVDVVVTRGESDASKPSPDLVVAAVDELGFPPSRCAMVGDTVYDGQPATQTELLEAGALAVWQDVAHLLSELDRALEIASLAPVASE